MPSLIKSFKEDKLINSSNIYDNGRLLNKVLENYRRIIKQMPTVDGEGESITLNGCINAEFLKFELGGNTSQEGGASPENYQSIHKVTGNNSIKTANTDSTEYNLVEFTLEEGQDLYKGDYLADDGIHFNRGKMILDGTEDWKATISTPHKFYLSLPKNSYIKRNGITCLCSHFSAQSNVQGTSYVNNNCVCFYHMTLDYWEFYCGYKLDSGATLEQFKTFLQEQYQAGTPVEVVFIRPETIVPYTETQQQQYNKLKTLLSHAGTTIITQENEDLPFNLSVSALKDLHTLEYANYLNE